MAQNVQVLSDQKWLYTEYGQVPELRVNITWWHEAINWTNIIISWAKYFKVYSDTYPAIVLFTQS